MPPTVRCSNPTACRSGTACWKWPDPVFWSAGYESFVGLFFAHWSAYSVGVSMPSTECGR